MLDEAGFRPVAVEHVLKRHDFAEWTSRQGCSEETVSRLVVLMREMSPAAREWMRPERWGEAGATFCDHHIILLADAA